jgi:hypothetical protein
MKSLVKHNMLKITAYCVYSPTSPFFLLLCEQKHCDNAATITNSEKSTSRITAIMRGRVDMGRKISPELDAFVLLDSTMLLSVLSWHAFWNLSTVCFFDFLIVSRSGKLWIWGSVCISFVGFVRPSVHLSAWNISAVTRQDIMMTDIWVLFDKTLTKSYIEMWQQ